MSLGFAVLNPNAIAKYHKGDLYLDRSSIIVIIEKTKLCGT